VIRIVDYGVGNIQAFLNLFKRIGIDAARAENPKQLRDATRLILPGVGHFDHAMAKLAESGFRPELDNLILGARVPIIGICVGMQMLAEGSDEGVLPGLNWIPGRVRAFTSRPSCEGLAMPHMGWNELKPTPGSRLFSRGFAGDPQFYFLHSYFFDAQCRNDVAAKATYGIEFDAVVSRNNIHGIQCHPEKSHHWGEQILRNFVELG